MFFKRGRRSPSYNLSIVLDEEFDEWPSIMKQGESPTITAGSVMQGKIYLTVTRTIRGTHLGLELLQEEESTFLKHAQVSKQTKLVYKTKIAQFKNYIKPGNYELPFHFELSNSLAPSTVVKDPGLSVSGRHGLTRVAPKRSNKSTSYKLRVRLPGDIGERLVVVRDTPLAVAASPHPTIPSVA
mmetsp:Transcript_21030/g.29688  ORF Transcript_21030/g.29688 Transcript_21030/m.29688 type:complete len:184 (+) Transcript_21030:114-665(+)